QDDEDCPDGHLGASNCGLRSADSQSGASRWDRDGRGHKTTTRGARQMGKRFAALDRSVEFSPEVLLQKSVVGAVRLHRREGRVQFRDQALRIILILKPRDGESVQLVRED